MSLSHPILLTPENQLVISKPARPPSKLFELVMFRGVLPLVAPLYLAYKSLTDAWFRTTLLETYRLVSRATARPESSAWYFQDASLLSRLWKLPSARAYLDASHGGEPHLEYQLREGYCGSATQRCILKSLGYRHDEIPEQHSGETKPTPWCEHVQSMVRDCNANATNDNTNNANNYQLTTDIIDGGAVSYEEFVTTIREGLDRPNVRIACNFLRPALTGFTGWRIFPMNFLTGLFAGHFSPILGILDVDDAVESPLVAVFDTNDKYGGTYFVSARRLYQAVHAVDLSAHKHRALILVTKEEIA